MILITFSTLLGCLLINFYIAPDAPLYVYLVWSAVNGLVFGLSGLAKEANGDL